LRRLLCAIGLVVALCLLGVPPSAATSDLTRTYTAQISYPANAAEAHSAQIALTQLADFLRTVTYYQGVNYALIRMVLHNDLSARQGYTADGDRLGGVCVAASLLDSIVRNAVFRDTDNVEKAVFQSLGIVNANNPPCTIQLSMDSKKGVTQDYVWRLNPNYDGPPPHLLLSQTAGGASLTLTYGDRRLPPVIAAHADSPQGSALLLADQWSAITKGRKLGVALLPITPVHGVDEAGYHADEQYAVASAFKGPVAIYFFEHIAPQVWQGVPIRYWNIDKLDAVPDAYRAAWTEYHAILKNVYQMAVFSDNDATGKTLGYVYDNGSAALQASGNPVRAFNDWSQRTVGISAASGLHAWLVGERLCAACTDDRYANRTLVYAGKVLAINNTYSPRDLAQFYVYLATRGRTLGYYDAAIDLLSNQHFSMIKENTLPFGIATASKDGYIAPNSDYGNGYRISTDAGLITLPDGEQYAVAFMAFDSGDLLPASVQAMGHAVIEAQRAEF